MRYGLCADAIIVDDVKSMPAACVGPVIAAASSSSAQIVCLMVLSHKIG